MARRNLEVVVTVRDAASQPLDKINNKVRDTGKAAKDASIDFHQFNKTLFTTAAFVATFVKGFSALRESLDQGAELDRLANQYERVLGPKGKLFAALDNVTTTTIDKTTALQEGLKLANLGIVKDQGQLAEILGKAGTAAKMAGMDSGEGVKRFSEFLASGSVNQLEFLGLIARTNPALQAQMAVLSKAGGVMGGVISTQAKLALGMNLLNAATAGQLKQTRDLVDIMTLAKTNYSYLRSEVGRFLGTALGPVIEKLSIFMFQIANTVDGIRKNSKELVFLGKATLVVTSAVVGLTAALGTLRLMVKLLSFAGIGLPALTFGLLTLGSAFLGITKPVDGLMKKLELFGGFVKGVWELITNLDPESGLSKMSKSTYDMLKKAGLLDFVQTVARVGSVIKTVATDIYTAVADSFKLVDSIVGGFFNKLFTYFGNFTKTWTTWWTSDSISGFDKVIRAIAGVGMVLGGVLAAFASFKIFSGVLSKIPIIGKLFGGGGKGSGPSGTSSDPIYTRSTDSLAGKVGSGMLDGLLGAGFGGFLDRIISKGGIIGAIANIPRLFTSYLGALGNTLMAFVGTLGTKLVGLAPLMGQALGVAAAGIIGYQVGSYINDLIDKNTQGKTSEGFEGSIIERGLFKLSNLTGVGSGKQIADQLRQQQDFQSKSNSQLVNELRAKQGKPPLSPEEAARLDNGAMGKVSPISVPYNAQDEMAKLDALGEPLKQLHGAQLAQQQTAIENALATNSQNGAQLSADEMNTLLSSSNDYLKQIADNTSKAQSSTSIRGSVRP